MTTVYHLGYRDFRSPMLARPVTADIVRSVPTLVTLNPIATPINRAALHVAAQPGMQTLPRHPDLLGHLGHRITGQDRQDGLIPLLHDRHSHQCQSRLPGPVLPANNT